ncbi:hypothetical protein SAMN05444272_3617 [Roseibium suaedae]|uniref:Uncharacterized protein n=2 Tax=Roseibium suaedae TaxID=735517 RepID=A0A1M7MYT9_9HYPH|nr:hypothetical protein SAMN05444272_3617 [Roseibium suaedae]
MQVNPVRYSARPNMRQRRPYEGQREEPRDEQAFKIPPVPLEPRLEEAHDRMIARYRPNSVFLAHLIATRDHDPQTRTKRQTEPENGVRTYRETAASPRKRAAGYVLSTSL